MGSSSSGENPTTMGSHGRKGFEQGSSKIRRAGKSKKQNVTFNTQDSGKTDRELDRSEDRDPFIS